MLVRVVLSCVRHCGPFLCALEWSSLVFVPVVLSCVRSSGPLLCSSHWSSLVFDAVVLSCSLRFCSLHCPRLCSLQWFYLVFVTVVLVTAHPLQDSDKSTLIVGGKTSAKGRWPWQLSLQVTVTPQQTLHFTLS